MTQKSPGRKRGPKPRPLVSLRVGVAPHLDAMVEQIVVTTGASKASVVSDALARYGEQLGLLPEGTTERIHITKTSGGGVVAPTRKEHT